MSTTDLDSCLQLVADPQRRCILQYIRDKPGDAIAIDELVDEVSRMIADGESDSTLDQDRLIIQLSHVHLPKFAEHGIVDYDRDNSTVHYKPNEQIESLLSSFPEAPNTVSF